MALLWPRFELILEMNVQSVRTTDPQRLGGLDTRPHYVRAGEDNKGSRGHTQRWAGHCRRRDWGQELQRLLGGYVGLAG